MNVAFFLKPKQEVAYIYDDFTLRQTVEKMKVCGYTAIPVITREGKYAGTVSDGDILWAALKIDEGNSTGSVIRAMEKYPVTRIIKTDRYKSVNFTADIEKLFSIVLNQNFVPVTDDTGSFSGIVTRSSVMHYFMTNPG